MVMVITEVELPKAGDECVVEIRLSHAQALVLFEFLSRETDTDREQQPLRLAHPAEERVLWAIEGQLESALVEIVRPDYDDSVQAARESIVAEE